MKLSARIKKMYTLEPDALNSIWKWLKQSKNERYDVANSNYNATKIYYDTFEIAERGVIDHKVIYNRTSEEKEVVFLCKKDNRSLYDQFYANNGYERERDVEKVLLGFNNDDILYIKEVFNYCDVSVIYNRDRDSYWLSCAGTNVIYLTEYNKIAMNHMQGGGIISGIINKLLS